jgi:death-on-curing protein
MGTLVFLTVEEVVVVHERVIEEFGGDPGLRDRGLLESAAAMPQAMFAGQFLHFSLAEMGAAYHFHLCSNHPFIDGNKRVGVAAAELFLLLNGHELSATDDEIESITLGLASGAVSKEELTEFYKAKTVADFNSQVGWANE